MENKYTEILKSVMKLIEETNARKQLENEYCVLVNSILNGFMINGTWCTPHTDDIYKIVFNYEPRTKKIVFDYKVANSDRPFDIYELKTSNAETIAAIKYLVDISKIDEFLKYLLDTVIPAYQRYEYISDSREYYFAV